MARENDALTETQQVLFDLIEKVAVSAQSLGQISEELQKSVAVFKLNGAGVEAQASKN